MNNLYNKIYEAINTGIQKALILDPDNDVSVKWHEKNKTSDMNLISHYVDELLNDNDDEYYYNQIIEYYNNTGYRYKCEDIDELFRIFNKIKNFGIFPEIFKWVDTRNSLSLILDNDYEISLSDYNENLNPLFLKISNNALRSGNNDILIYIPENHYIPEDDMSWQTNNLDAQDKEYHIEDETAADIDYTGYETCLRIINDKRNRVVPAIEYCLSLNNINGHKSYLPAAGQLRIMSDYLELINYVFKNIQAETMDLNNDNWWSSSECDWSTVWCLHKGHNSYRNGVKSNKFIVLPIFTL